MKLADGVCFDSGCCPTGRIVVGWIRLTLVVFWFVCGYFLSVGCVGFRRKRGLYQTGDVFDHGRGLTQNGGPF